MYPYISAHTHTHTRTHAHTHTQSECSPPFHFTPDLPPPPVFLDGSRGRPPKQAQLSARTARPSGSPQSSFSRTFALLRSRPAASTKYTRESGAGKFLCGKFFCGEIPTLFFKKRERDASSERWPPMQLGRPSFRRAGLLSCRKANRMVD